MTEKDLSSKDKELLKGSLKFQFIVTFFFVLAFIGVLSLLMGAAVLISGKVPVPGFLQRSVLIAAGVFLPLLILPIVNFKAFKEIKTGKKLVLKTTFFEIIYKKKEPFILIKDCDIKEISIYRELVPLLNPKLPLTIEITPKTKSLLFISHDTHNLIDD